MRLFLTAVLACVVACSPESAEKPASPAPSSAQGQAVTGSALAGAVQVTAPATVQRSFADWKDACSRLPSNRALRNQRLPQAVLPIQNFAEFDHLLDEYFALCKTGAMGQTNLWVGEAPTANAFFNTESAYFLKPDAAAAPYVQQFLRGTRNPGPVPPFQPFAQKLEISENAEMYFHADLHGDIRSLLANLTWLNENGYLRDFSIIKPDFYMVLTGDYTDRGNYGIEVLYTLLRLKLANPDKVILLRGNHEEFSIAARYGFLSEGMLKYGSAFNIQKVIRAYDFLPVVAYIGTADNMIQCHHGGMEPGYNPRSLLDAEGPVRFQFLGALNQRRFLNENPQWSAQWERRSQDLAAQAFRDFTPEGPVTAILGFMWNDFSLFADDPEFFLDPGRAFVYGRQATQYLLSQQSTEKTKIRAIFRGHQQSSLLNPMMRRQVAGNGVFRHWQERDNVVKSEASAAELSQILERAPVRTIPPGSVWTFNVSPDSVYGEGCKYTFDTFGILRTAKNFDDWRLHVFNIDIPR